MAAPPRRIVPEPGQESVWDYPRPPRVENTSRHLQVVFNGVVVADTHQGRRVLETSGAPVYYFPPQDVRSEYLIRSEHQTFCEWKGLAVHHTFQVDGRSAMDAAWSYPEPTPGYEAIRDYLAFYPQAVDACLVDGERVQPQPGGYYGGWITHDIVGPFKGAPGTEPW